MEKVKEALTQPALRTVPEDASLALLNGRALFTNELVNGDAKYPEQGTFDSMISAVRHETTAEIDGEKLIIRENKKLRLTLTPTAVDVFLARVNSQEYSIMRDTPSYTTILHLVDAKHDFYLRIFGGRAGKYLVAHPQSLPVKDVLNLKSIETGKTENELAQAINTLGYEKLVAGTELAFLSTADYHQFLALSPR